MELCAIGRRIKAARESAGLTQEALADAVGLSVDHISVIERGVKLPRIDTFVLIANTLGVSADTLLQDVVQHSSESVISGLVQRIMQLPQHEQDRFIKVVEALLE